MNFKYSKKKKKVTLIVICDEHLNVSLIQGTQRLLT